MIFKYKWLDIGLKLFLAVAINWRLLEFGAYLLIGIEIGILLALLYVNLVKRIKNPVLQTLTSLIGPPMWWSTYQFYPNGIADSLLWGTLLMMGAPLTMWLLISVIGFGIQVYEGMKGKSKTG
jgi:hypothetical protein